VTSEERDVTLTATGSALGSAAVIDIKRGQGVITISNLVAETSRLALVDSAQTGFITSATLDLTWTAGAHNFRSNRDCCRDYCSSNAACDSIILLALSFAFVAS
jgi:hypothetical protein